MQYEVSAAQIKQAQVPHNLFVSGALLIHLLMTPAVIAMKVGMVGILIPLSCSAVLLGYIYQRSRKNTTWFVDAHWRLAFQHAQWLMIGYAISATLILLAWLISQAAHSASMQHIMWTAMTRIAIIPTLIAVMVTSIAEAGAIGIATRREVPDKIVEAFPPRL
ncbi:MAG: hypothetical protein PHU06_04350 [Gallionella sp.]|nr:hypothetical protein [Gallionella sp.]MDD4957911.1 hypothetical protein [Gallionella sp.]